MAIEVSERVLSEALTDLAMHGATLLSIGFLVRR